MYVKLIAIKKKIQQQKLYILYTKRYVCTSEMLQSLKSMLP